MSDTKTISWIFLSIAISSENAPIDYNSIRQVADGINHAIPTDKELQTSINWMIKNDLILKISKKYSLTEKGSNLYSDSTQLDNVIFKIWSNIEKNIKDYE